MNCLECNTQVPRLKSHLKKEHGLEDFEYYYTRILKLTEPPKCPTCQVTLSWKGFGYGNYGTYCSHKCQMNHSDTLSRLSVQMSEINQRPEIKAESSRRFTEFNQSPEGSARSKEVHNRPEIKEATSQRMSELQLKRWAQGDFDDVEIGSKRGIYQSSKSPIGVLFTWRSDWELQIFRHLDEDNSVVSWTSEGLKLPYLDEVGKQRTYNPDLLINFITGNKLVEIKPDYKVLEPRNQCKFAAARNYCELNNFEFGIWTESTCPYWNF